MIRRRVLFLLAWFNVIMLMGLTPDVFLQNTSNIHASNEKSEVQWSQMYEGSEKDVVNRFDQTTDGGKDLAKYIESQEAGGLDSDRSNSPNQGDVKSVALVIDGFCFGAPAGCSPSFDKMAIQGASQSADKYGNGLNIEYVTADYYSRDNQNFQIDTLWDLAEHGEYDLIIVLDSVFGGIVNPFTNSSKASQYPSQKFVFLDNLVEAPNVASVTFRMEEASFLNGALAAMTTKSNKLGYLGGLDNLRNNVYLAGFVQGAYHINPKIEISAKYLGDRESINPYGDTSGAQLITRQFFNDGVDIVFAAAGVSGMGAIQAAKSWNWDNDNKVYAMGGFDYDLDDFGPPGNVLISSMKYFDWVVQWQIDALFNNTWTDGVFSLGLAENGVGLSNMNFTQEEANQLFEYDSLTMTRFEILSELSEKIIQGEITVSANYSRPVDDRLDNRNLIAGLIGLSVFIGLGFYILKFRSIKEFSGLAINKTIKEALSLIFNSRTSQYLLLTSRFQKPNQEEISGVHIPQELFKYKFLMHPVRLAMMKILTESPNMINSELKAKLKLSWGEINHHLPTMEKQNLILIEDRFVDGITKKTISITLEGSMQYVSLVEILQEFLNSPESDTYPETLGINLNNNKN